MVRGKMTQESLDIVTEISKTVKTFHHHYHILYDLAREFDHVNYFEIGTYAGASACLMLQRPDTWVVTVDTGQFVPKNKVIDTLSAFSNGNMFFYLEGHSWNLYDKVKPLFPEGIDIMFIDGDHQPESIKNDFFLYEGLVNKGGYIVFDDYNDHIYNPQIKPAIDELVKHLTNYEVIGSPDNVFNAPVHWTINNKSICFIIKKLQ